MASSMLSIAALALAAVALGGCSTAASMRVDVQVYKGPLSKELEIQVGELTGVLKGVDATLDGFMADAEARLKEKEAAPGNVAKYAKAMHEEIGKMKKRVETDKKNEWKCPASAEVTKETIKQGLGDVAGEAEKLEQEARIVPYCAAISRADELHRRSAELAQQVECRSPAKLEALGSADASFSSTWSERIAGLQLRDMQRSYCEVAGRARMLRGTANALARQLVCCVSDSCAGMQCPGQSESTWASLKPALRATADLAANMKLQALNLAYYMNTWRFSELDRRIMTANYTNLLAETSNQLSSRADALLKQIGGQSADTLPQSVYLRDSATTSLLNMYVWDGAMNPPLPEDANFFDREDRADRVRALEQHFADHYWSTINTVVASGEGKVGMALIKDDIGNWNLKNFENDPTELVGAYKAVGLAALSTAADLVKQAELGPLNKAEKFAALADRFNFGESGQGASSLDGVAVELHASTAASLKAVAAEMRDKPLALRQQREEKETAIGKIEAEAISGCAPEAPAAAAQVVAGARTAVYRVLADLPASSESKSAAEAGAAAKRALAAADAAKDAVVCAKAAEAKSEADKAALWLETYRLEVEEGQVPASARTRLSDLLAAYERTLTELARAGLAKAETATAAPAGK